MKTVNVGRSHGTRGRNRVPLGIETACLFVWILVCIVNFTSLCFGICPVSGQLCVSCPQGDRNMVHLSFGKLHKHKAKLPSGRELTVAIKRDELSWPRGFGVLCVYGKKKEAFCG